MKDELPEVKECEHCNGTGAIGVAHRTCPQCKGDGCEPKSLAALERAVAEREAKKSAALASDELKAVATWCEWMKWPETLLTDGREAMEAAIRAKGLRPLEEDMGRFWSCTIYDSGCGVFVHANGDTPAEALARAILDLVKAGGR